MQKFFPFKAVPPFISTTPLLLMLSDWSIPALWGLAFFGRNKNQNISVYRCTISLHILLLVKTTNDWYHIFSSYKESVFSWIIKLSVLLSPLFVLSCTCCNSLTETIFQVCSTTAYIRSSSTSTRQVWIVACLQNPMIRLSIGSTSFLPLLHYFFPLNLWRIAFGINCPNRKRLGIDLRETVFRGMKFSLIQMHLPMASSSYMIVHLLCSLMSA